MPDPELCRTCGSRGKVYKSIRKGGYRLRRHQCPRCGSRWNSYQSVINPLRITLKPGAPR